MEFSNIELGWILVSLEALKDWKEVSVNRAYEWENVAEAELIQADMVDISMLIDKVKQYLAK